ncbi:hypothetical protein SPRG_02031 [Saprolegnia parasitica CBS 223.65]|uniref:protein-tyrosine-phosphatase n=1 Tax=Saprolegnia parasitica (strain CBS 223.65) TaxID=695850 RepID=A0A067D3D5_SAPPC|nr:hypothetical protein SPRG_02031 [Saprolegnia parasitica CBS 223.65]KDO33221.1 hypothetical protein SPRG_02031 [Saprolegnia parasitica CBS 223.65]|eukprot:XP_012195978.1 hypothetical protein SPRG_02031 [Saprolegnia parasitica CBS 223.65]
MVQPVVVDAGISYVAWSPDDGPLVADEPNNTTLVFLETDDLAYARFFADFGPLPLGQVVRFLRTLQTTATSSTRVLCYSTAHPQRQANAIALLTLYRVLVLELSPAEAFLPFQALLLPLFRDASYGVCTFGLSILDCAAAMHKAVARRLFALDTFDVDRYEAMGNESDMHWIVPQKLVALPGPTSQPASSDRRAFPRRVDDVALELKALNVSCVVRLNDASDYAARTMVAVGLRHVELPCADGGTPSEAQLASFFSICDREKGAVAVHCEGGLGRTGTAIAAYLIHRYGFTAPEAIAWCRLCRPGSVLGQQQHFLMYMAPRLRALPPTAMPAKTTKHPKKTKTNKTMVTNES